jgi:hypothetical protein
MDGESEPIETCRTFRGICTSGFDFLAGSERELARAFLMAFWKRLVTLGVELG